MHPRPAIATFTALTAIVTAGLVVLGEAGVSASPLSRERTQQAFALAYDLQFQAAHLALAEAVAADPADPAPHRASAAIIWVEILFAQGVATFEAFTGGVPKGDVVRPVPPAALTARYRQAITRAIDLAESVGRPARRCGCALSGWCDGRAGVALPRHRRRAHRRGTRTGPPCGGVDGTGSSA